MTASGEPTAVDARELTARGIARARRFLDAVRTKPSQNLTPPQELLASNEFSRPFRDAPKVARRSFATRREVGEYFSPRLAPIKRQVADRASFWSWLGIFYFEDMVRAANGSPRLARRDETFVIDPRDPQSRRNRHRHYLRSAWQLYETHGEDAAFLLDQAPEREGAIADRVMGSQRIFNSEGLVPLILRMYTVGTRQKRGFMGRPGGMRHLLRVLDQLERTYDVHHMSPEALMRILPPEFESWTKPDPKLARWESKVRAKGAGTMRYRGHTAHVAVNAAGGKLEAQVEGPASAGAVGAISAYDATELRRRLRKLVSDLQRNQRETRSE